MAKEKNAFCALLLLAALSSIPLLSLAQTNTKGAQADLLVAPMKGKVYALVVGVSDYKADLINDLRYAAADARAVAEYLKTGPLKVELLIELYDKVATKGGILDKGFGVIDRLVTNQVIQPEDMILVYLSGHGGAFTKDNSFFFPHDAAHATDAVTSFSIKRIKGNIRNWCTESKATVIFVFDACRSATMVKGQSELDLTEVSKFLEEDTGELLLAASEGGEPALEKAELRHGVFSYCLLEALYGKADTNGDGWVSVGELKTYLDTHVPDRTKTDPTQQRPMVKYPAGFGKKLVVPVTPELLARADEKLKLDLSSAPVVQLAAKGGSSNAKANQLTELIARFREALDNGKLVRPTTECAYYYFQEMTKLVPASSLQAELTDLNVALYDKALATLNEDINGERGYMRASPRGLTYNTNYYGDARKCMEAYVQLAGKQRIDPDIEALVFYLAGRDLAVQYLESDDYRDLIKQAIRKLKQGVEKYPDQAFLWQGLAMTYLDDPKSPLDEAVKAANKARDLAPRWSYPLITLALCSFEQDDQAAAVKFVEEALALNKFDFYSFFLAGYLFASAGQYEDAIEKFKMATELNPSFTFAYFQWGLSLFDLEKGHEAVEKFKKATELNPGYSAAYLYWGVILEATGKKDEAVEKYKMVTQLDPSNGTAYNNWGVILSDLGHDNEAIEKFKKAVEVEPTDPTTYSNWAGALYNLGKMEDCIEKCKKAIELDPSYGDAYLDWGDALKMLGRDEEAIEKYKKAIELDPSDGRGYYQIGQFQSKLGRAAEAEANYRKAIDLAGDELWLLAWSYLRLKEWDKSKSLFEEIIRSAPDDVSGYYDYACFFALTDKPSEALKQLEIAFSKGWKDWPYLERDKNLNSLRGLKEFNDLVGKYKTP